jgi:23S rRNA (cytosine1962-C5)-methyltransferase
MDKCLVLKPGREKSVLRRHPWIFSGAVQEVRGEPQKSDTLAVESAKGEFLGYCGYNPDSSIRGRMWTFDKRELGASLFKEKMRIAISLRKELSFLNSDNNACRLVHAESDGLPGLVVDQYNDHLVVQFLTAAADAWRGEIIAALADLTGIKTIYERSDVDVRRLEGLAERKGILFGEEPPDKIQITENGLNFLVDIKHGQKTGFYLDQRENRAALAEFVQDKDMLNCFSYTGGFTVYGLKAGAKSALSIDSSQEANDIALENIRLNGLNERKAHFITGDVFQALRQFRDARRSFDLIVLDPPKFAATSAQSDKAARGYKDINLLAFKLLKPGGLLFTFSCSGGVSRELFQKIVADAALDAGVSAVIVRQLSQGPDHPVALNFPEGEYLKGLVCKIQE